MGRRLRENLAFSSLHFPRAAALQVAGLTPFLAALPVCPVPMAELGCHGQLCTATWSVRHLGTLPVVVPGNYFEVVKCEEIPDLMT